jgi:hypothetical protein
MSTDLAAARERGDALASPRLLRKARAALAEAETLRDITTLVVEADAVREVARRADLSRDAQNDWGEYALDAKRKGGELLTHLRAAGALRDGRPGKQGHHGPVSGEAPLVRLGLADDPVVARHRSKRWQQLAAIPEPDYERWKAEQRAAKDGELTQQGALALARMLTPAKSHAQADAERKAAVQAAVDAGLAAPAGASEWPTFGHLEQAEAMDYLRRLKRTPVRAHLAVTSPPFWMLRTYTPGDGRELGQEPTPGEYVRRLCEIVDAIGDVLVPEGVLVLNLGDTYASQPGQYRGDPDRARGISAQGVRANGTAPAGRVFDVPPKSLCLIPERVAVELVLARGWRLASTILWVQKGHAPENVHDRPEQGYEFLFVLTRAEHCYWLKRTGEPEDPTDDYWEMKVGRGGAAAGQLAPFPDELVARAIRHGCPERAIVLDPFAGSGTVRDVAHRMGRRFLGCDLAPPAVPLPLEEPEDARPQQR